MRELGRHFIWFCLLSASAVIGMFIILIWPWVKKIPAAIKKVPERVKNFKARAKIWFLDKIIEPLQDR